MSPGGSRNAIDELVELMQAGYPLLHISSWEEERVEATLARIAGAITKPPLPFYVWSVTRGLVERGKTEDRTGGPQGSIPVSVLDTVLGATEPALYMLKDFHDFLDDSVIQRQLRDVYSLLRDKRRFVVLSSPGSDVPDGIRRFVRTVDFPLPSAEEIEPVILAVARKHLGSENLSASQLSRYVAGCSGLTLSEIHLTLNRVWKDGGSAESREEALFRSKAELIRRENVLEFITPKEGLDDVAGLSVLKGWLLKRTKLVLDAARGASDAAMPRGVLFMGISGCGKSLSVKAIARQWGLPLVRLDMNLVFSEAYGRAEESFHRALKIVEATAPAVLWLDEIEMGLSASAAVGTQARVFAHFLTWMQERRAPVFVAATANRIDLLPAEMIRRGRFDQLFFVDLPNEEERKGIFRVHLTAQGLELGDFDFISLAASTKGWNGAEIEHIVRAAAAEVYGEDRKLSMADLYGQIQQTIPLSTTMQEQIKQIRSWANKRALHASGGPDSR